MVSEFYSFLWDHGDFEVDPRCFTNTGACSSENMFTLNFCGQEWIFAVAINLVHESMFSMFVFMRVQEKYLSQSLW